MLYEWMRVVKRGRRGAWPGHTSYFTPGATQATTTRYLTTGQLPAPATILPDRRTATGSHR